jgi:hypothetical protein
MKLAKMFPLAGGGVLEVKETLCESLYIDKRLLRQNSWSTDTQHLKLFVEGAEQAWGKVLTKFLEGEVNPILWLRDVLSEAHRSKVRIPMIFIKRLRQLERGDLLLYVGGAKVSLPLHAGLPREFRDCCALCGWKFPSIVPNLDGNYLDLFDRSIKTGKNRSEFVRAVVAIWKTHPCSPPADLKIWAVSELAKRGWKVTDSK